MPPTYPNWIYDGSEIEDPFGYGERAVRFLKALRHPLSTLPNRAFQLDPWQERIVRRIYGPRHLVDDPATGIRKGQRVVNTAFLYLPRGNRKTSLAAALGLLHTFGPERVPRGQSITAAADRKQARLAYEEAVAILKTLDKKSQGRVRIQDYKNALVFSEQGSKYEAISCDAGTQHGRTPSFAFIDELHIWKNRFLWEAITTGVDKVDNSLTVIATTAGRGSDNLAHEITEKARQIARGEIVDPTFLPVIFEAAADCDWRDEAVWRQVNPGLAHGYPSLSGFRRSAERAEHSNPELDSFKQLKLNIQIAKFESAAFDMLAFDKGKTDFDFEDLKGREAWIGVDLSRRGDQTAVVAVVKDGANFIALPYIFIPGEGMIERSDKDHAPYVSWVKDGHVIATPGPTIDFGIVEDCICDLCAHFDVQSINFDETFASEMMASLIEKGHPAIAFPQHWSTLSPAAEDLIKCVKDRRFLYNPNPAFRWNFENSVVVASGRTSNITFHKEKSRARIDPVVATAMALSRAIALPPEKSIYEEDDFDPRSMAL